MERKKEKKERDTETDTDTDTDSQREGVQKHQVPGAVRACTDQLDYPGVFR